jgi:hypothetical protein
VPADQAHAQMDPGTAGLLAIFTFKGRGRKIFYLFYMSALFLHCSSKVFLQSETEALMSKTLIFISAMSSQSKRWLEENKKHILLGRGKEDDFIEQIVNETGHNSFRS